MFLQWVVLKGFTSLSCLVYCALVFFFLFFLVSRKYSTLWVKILAAFLEFKITYLLNNA